MYYVPGTYLPHPTYKTHGPRFIRDPYCMTPTGVISHVQEKKGVQHGFPQELHFIPRTDGTTKCEINYTEETYGTREQNVKESASRMGRECGLEKGRCGPYVYQVPKTRPIDIYIYIIKKEDEGDNSRYERKSDGRIAKCPWDTRER